MDAQSIYEILLLVGPLLLSLTVHEYAHARTALAFGDATAKNQGRCTLNPLAHLDPIGTIVLVVTRFIGWARPVPVNPNNLHPRRLGDIAVSLAGPMSNFCLAVLCGLGLKLLYMTIGAPKAPLERAGFLLLGWTMMANIGLGMFNLIPLFPLDGHHILRESLPTTDQRMRFMQWQIRYGRIALAALIFAPMVLETVLRRKVFRPISWLFVHVLGFALRVLDLGDVLPYMLPSG
ncbi:MAG: site-2 protease family protein [Phycisphaerae bacterium]|nr:site-2 protease family protein [Phycisphaerae bacterium]